MLGDMIQHHFPADRRRAQKSGNAPHVGKAVFIRGPVSQPGYTFVGQQHEGRHYVSEQELAWRSRSTTINGLRRHPMGARCGRAENGWLSWQAVE